MTAYFVDDDISLHATQLFYFCNQSYACTCDRIIKVFILLTWR
jgi:hypothetical protein